MAISKMTREEVIAQLKMDRDLCNFNPMTGEEEPMNEDCRKSAEALDRAIKSLEQEHCEDAVSRKTVLNTLNRMDSVLDEDRTVETYKELLIACYNDLPPVTPTHTEIVTEFADRCRECGKTAITRAENDEILNEARSLLVNATEKDGVTPEEANGMIKLLAFFLYKYHDQKKPEWVESVEARLEGKKPTEGLKMHPIKDGFPKTNSGIYLVQDADGRIWEAEYDECQDNPEERFGEWAQIFDPQTLGEIDREWDPYTDIVAWCELPKLVPYEEEE